MSICLYHKEYARTGRVFKDNVDPALLAEQGWVDNPMKIGENPWGPNAEAEVDRTH